MVPLNVVQDTGITTHRIRPFARSQGHSSSPCDLPGGPQRPGWWIVAALLSTSLVVLWLRFRGYWLSPSRAAIRELARIRREFRVSGDSDALAAQLSVFLRRAVLAAYPREDVAGLSGDAWLNFLDRTGATSTFTDGPGRTLIAAPYQRSSTFEAESLLLMVETWVRHALAVRGPGT